jgi:hypothetical protein
LQRISLPGCRVHRRPERGKVKALTAKLEELKFFVTLLLLAALVSHRTPLAKVAEAD